MTPRYARIAAELLRTREPVSVPGSALDASRGSAIIEHAMLGQARRRARRRVWVILPAAAALLVVAGATAWNERTATDGMASAAVVRASGSDVSIVRTSGELVPAADQRLGRAERLITGQSSSALVQLPLGSRLIVRGSSDLRITELGTRQWLSLYSGEVQADVVKLKPDQSFVISTSDADVEVRGTSFEVRIVERDPKCPDAPTTRVAVSEGLVMVRFGRDGRVLLRAGEHWPEACAESKLGAEAPRPAPPEPPAEGGARESRVPPAGERALQSADRKPPAVAADGWRATASSSLADQNALFAAAMSAKQRGDLPGAIRRLDVLMERHPSTPLFESAMVESMKLSHSTGSPRAAVAARRYLELFPNGFARRQARTIAGASE